VLVLGTGGLNSTVIQHLAGLGVGRLLLPPVLALRERRLRRSGRLLQPCPGERRSFSPVHWHWLAGALAPVRLSLDRWSTPVDIETAAAALIKAAV
jgi:hypothetical protein